MSECAINLDNISKKYGSRNALTSFCLQVERGSFHALLGPNGSGKSTTLRILMGFIRPNSGQGSVLGFPLGDSYPPVNLKARIGYVPERSALYESMTARNILDFAREINPRWDPKAERRYTDLFALPMNVRVRQMSTGVRAQLALTLAMGARPELLILDEPTSGLDAAQRFHYLQALVEDCIEDGRTVLLSSHDLYQMERIADHITILIAGKRAVTGSLDEVTEREKRVRIAGNTDDAVLAGLPGVRKVARESSGFLVHLSGNATKFEAAARQVQGITGIQIIDQSLEEIFLSYVE